METGVDFIDTAEVYGYGKSEEFLGEFMKKSATTPIIATKFPPLPWRLSKESVPIALKASLQRLQLDKVGLYMIHWPGFFLNAFSNDAYIEGLGMCVEQGLTDAVGVSNFSTDRLRRAHEQLQKRGVGLASNQVQYSLLYRKPETNGVMETCRELGVTLVAYSPIAQGLLTGGCTFAKRVCAHWNAPHRKVQTWNVANRSKGCPDQREARERGPTTYRSSESHWEGTWR